MQKLNFGHNVAIEPKECFAPKTEAEVLELLNRNRGRSIRCIGRMHSWSEILECSDLLLDLRNFSDAEPIYGEQRQVVVGAGMQIKHLLAELQRKAGWTLPSVGFITEQTIAGAISTGTHGSGRHSLSHYVMALRIARYDQQTGEAVIVDISDGDELRAARCSLGCLGIILSVTMQCRPMYLVEEHFREYKEIDDVLAAETEYPLQQFFLVPWRWSYFVQHRRESEQTASKTLWFYHWYRFLALDVSLHLLVLLVVRLFNFPAAIQFVFRWIAPACVIRGWRVTGPSSAQLVMEHELFRHIELELFVPRSRLPSALQFLKHSLVASADRGKTTEEPVKHPSAQGAIASSAARKLSSAPALDTEFHRQLVHSGTSDDLEPLLGTYCHHYPICVRKILPDDTLVSMASNAGKARSSNTPADSSGRASEAWYSITLTNYDHGQGRQRFSKFIAFLSKSMSSLFDARPHWGKLCPLAPAELRKLYPAFSDFQQFCHEADKEGVFRNRWTKQLLTEPERDEAI